ncbi:hypothetical protein Pint_36576 [Pistacia integerrima]|uniref:Uncharacterized protein n=1 Tax=Pistacia integerrima TaxID=434235 RepID=A0ACC0Y6G6_9ROSI|nr:hypothetical protein Pint_36576 [Pistacia integerrima]
MEECVLELPLGEAAANFDLETAVCSHGLFMLSPNHWDPLTKSLTRPLHLIVHSNSPRSPSITVIISQAHQDPHSLRIKLHKTPSGSLSKHQQDALVRQVVRMLRLSESDERNMREFKRVASEVGEGCDSVKDFSGRVFRSPTLFEDMVKCMLLCNCQWPRTLSMARALCELQFELQHCSFSSLVAGVKQEDFIPKTPAEKESKRRRILSKVSTSLTSKFAEVKANLEEDLDSKLNCFRETEENLNPSFPWDDIEDDSCAVHELSTSDLCLVSDLQSKGKEPYASDRIGNFPSPGELANIDEIFLAKRCNLGYRAGRIIKLAQAIVEGRIQLEQLEEICSEASLASYDKLAEQLSKIDGFGPFTCANVLVCMGFYHVIPSDSETIRHLKQVHKRKSTIKTVQKDVKMIYGKYAPFQFLAYWSEVWHFYEERFGKLSEMPYSNYKLITATLDSGLCKLQDVLNLFDYLA